MTTARPSWLVRRQFPLLATLVMTAIGMAGTIWGPRYYGKTAWGLPDDLWGTLIGAQRLIHLHLGGLYTTPTQLVSLPGTAIILIPAVAVMNLAGIAVPAPGAPMGHHPASWLIAGPYQVFISAVVLVAADALAERLGATQPKRCLLAAAGATTLWGVTIRWGHPEDAVAVGLLLTAIAALADAKTSRSAWLAGAAVAVQPLVLLALPVLFAVVVPKRWPGFLARAAAPSAVLLAIAAAANWTATVHAVTSQPNSPTIDHSTPWIYLAPHLAGGQVAAGPARILAIVAACGCGLVAGHRVRLAQPATGSRPAPSVAVPPRAPSVAVPPRAPSVAVPPPAPPAAVWRPEMLQQLLWWTAAALALRSAFEPVMVAYYLWPPLAVALIVASGRWSRLLPAGITAIVLTFFSQVQWRNPWAWWLPMITLLGLTLFFARAKTGRQRDGTGLAALAQMLPETGEQFVADGAP
jgi:hypothetical protein